VSVKLGAGTEYFVKWNDPQGNPLVSIDRAGVITCQNLNTPSINTQAVNLSSLVFPDGSIQKTAITSSFAGSTGEYAYYAAPNTISGLAGVFSFVGLGVTPNIAPSQSSAMTAAWNKIGSPAQVGIFPVGQIDISTSVTPTPGLTGYSAEGQGGSGATNASTNFYWQGGAGGTALYLDRQRDALIGRFSLNMNSAANATGLAITQQTATGGGISSHAFYHDIAVNNVGVGGTGIALGSVIPGDDGENNEGIVFWRYSSTGSGTGFSCSSSNARSIGLYEVEFSNSTALNMSAGSWHVIGGLTEQTSVALNWGGQIGFYGFVHDEGSAQGVVANSNGAVCGILMGNQYEVDSPNLSLPYWDFTHVGSSIITIGNHMNANPNMTNIVQPPTVGGSWLSIGDRFPNRTIANLPNLFSNPDAGLDGHIMIGTPNVAGAGVFIVGNTNGLWLAAHTGGSPGQQFNSPPLTVSSLYTDVFNTVHIVPIQMVAVMTSATGSSPVTWQLQTATDPITGTTYAGPINTDFGTNSNGGIMTVNKLLIQASSSPTSAGTAGITGQIAWDASKIYICTSGGIVGAATWKAATLSVV
jgi:hypothetical protein